VAKARVQKRLYYKIGEACKALGIQPYVLRYWETEFSALSPSKSRSGQRVYNEKELEVIQRIKQLLYDEGYTIAGAKKKLEGELAAGTLGDGTPLPPVGSAGDADEDEAAAGAAGLSADRGRKSAASSAIGLDPPPLPAPASGVGRPSPASPALPGPSAGLLNAATPGPGVPARRGTPEASAAGDIAMGGRATGSPASGVNPGSLTGATRSQGATGMANATAATGTTGAAETTTPPGAVGTTTSPGAVGTTTSPGAPGTTTSPGAPGTTTSPGSTASTGPAGAAAQAPAARPDTGPTAVPATNPGAAAANPGAKQDVPSARSAPVSVAENAAIAPIALHPPGHALDTDATKRIETLRTGIYKALQEAREILALLDSKSPQ
jgi:DNA-binding transcriptional MerR regulator